MRSTVLIKVDAGHLLLLRPPYTALRFDFKKQRWLIRMEDGSECRYKAENLHVKSATAPSSSAAAAAPNAEDVPDEFF